MDECELKLKHPHTSTISWVKKKKVFHLVVRWLELENVETAILHREIIAKRKTMYTHTKLFFLSKYQRDEA
jgi:hypothetical protein